MSELSCLLDARCADLADAALLSGAAQLARIRGRWLAVVPDSLVAEGEEGRTWKLVDPAGRWVAIRFLEDAA